MKDKKKVNLRMCGFTEKDYEKIAGNESLVQYGNAGYGSVGVWPTQGIILFRTPALKGQEGAPIIYTDPEKGYSHSISGIHCCGIRKKNEK